LETLSYEGNNALIDEAKRLHLDEDPAPPEKPHQE